MRDCQTVLSHAWMIRAFLRHCEDAEDFPELFELDRAIFELCRALEPYAEEPASYFKALRKKIGGFKTAVAKFAVDAPAASAHTNFLQAVLSAQGCSAALERCLAEATALGLLNPKTSTAQSEQGIG
ncbi:hypothetical protein SAMN05421753_11237 [Planctomicrobium piriforme]|uniref:Uncharacterized protein n=1 Tax=Planctomicrobium piriforme TaxID=1576369 RepID=A0A1I3KTG4_9PLAN|nr:hypothetical protein SAMN05421753_11237 [Planctomicrobium piriforme]